MFFFFPFSVNNQLQMMNPLSYVDNNRYASNATAVWTQLHSRKRQLMSQLFDKMFENRSVYVGTGHFKHQILEMTTNVSLDWDLHGGTIFPSISTLYHVVWCFVRVTFQTPSIDNRSFICFWYINKPDLYNAKGCKRISNEELTLHTCRLLYVSFCFKSHYDWVIFLQGEILDEAGRFAPFLPTASFLSKFTPDLFLWQQKYTLSEYELRWVRITNGRPR